MKIFLCDFSSPEFREAGWELARRGAEILYWTASKEAYKDLIKNKRKNCTTIFHDIFDAVKAVSAQGIDIFEFEPPSAALINEMSECESIVLTIMDRFDFGGMALARRKHIYYKYLQYWDGVLKKLKPDAIFFHAVPHSAYNFVLYSLAKKYGILTTMFKWSMVWARIMAVHDYDGSNETLLGEYERIKNENHAIDELSLDGKYYYQKLKDTKADVTPLLVKKQKKDIGKKLSFLPHWTSIWRSFKDGSAAHKIKFFLKTQFNVQQKEVLRLDEYDTAHYENIMALKKAEKIKRDFRAEYESLQSIPDFNRQFVYFPLSYQPECSTSPMAGPYSDMILIAKTLAAALPDNWLVYAKEYSVQWNQHNCRSHLCRYRHYYEELAKIKKLRLLPIATSSYDLINYSQAVATAGGSSGWEALGRGKPVLAFGAPMYMHSDGVFFIDSTEKCRETLEKIAAGYKLDAHKYLNYLIAFEKNTVRLPRPMSCQIAAPPSREEFTGKLVEVLWSELEKLKI